MAATRNYRMMRRKGEIGIFSVYYGDAGKARSWSEEPAMVVGDSVEEVTDCLDLMREALRKPVLEYE